MSVKVTGFKDLKNQYRTYSYFGPIISELEGSLREQIIRKLHDNCSGGQFGRSKTIKSQVQQLPKAKTEAIGVVLDVKEVEQLHKIFKLCGSPSEQYWKKSKLPNATLFKPQQPYKRRITETFKDFPSSSLSLIETLLSIDPEERSTATAALNSEFFTTEPYASEPSSLPKYPPSKEMDVKLRDEQARRQRGLVGKVNAVDGATKTKVSERTSRAVPAPEANAEIQANLDKWRVMSQTNAKSKSEKFPPPHQDGAVGHPLDASHKGPLSFAATVTSFSSSIFNSKLSESTKNSGPDGGRSRRSKTNKDPLRAPSRKFIRGFKPSSIGLSMDFLFRGKSEVFHSRN
ncbi:hypothetical protein V6N13_030735 [Hibiscus sabdariffa]